MDQATAQTHLDDALTQLAAARKAASYSMGDRAKSAQTIEALQREVTYWARIVDSYTASASGVVTTMAAVPRFR